MIGQFLARWQHNKDGKDDIHCRSYWLQPILCMWHWWIMVIFVTIAKKMDGEILVRHSTNKEGRFISKLQIFRCMELPS